MFEPLRRRFDWRWITAILGLIGLGWMVAASLLSFRQWMGEFWMQRQHHMYAIVWFTRAERTALQAGDSAALKKIRAALYRAYEGTARWEFESENLGGWFAAEQIDALHLAAGTLRLRASGDYPCFEILRLRLAPQQKYRLQWRMRCRQGRQGQLLWAPQTDVFDPLHRKEFALDSSGQWKEYDVELAPLSQELGKIRLVPGDAPGEYELDWIRLSRTS